MKHARSDRARKSPTATDADRRAGRDDRHGTATRVVVRSLDEGWEITPVGGVMDADMLERLRSAATDFDPTAAWDRVAATILPVLRRIHHPFPPELVPIQVLVPPGIWTGFGIDFGPAFGHVTVAQVEAWGVDTAELLATSLDNLRQLTRVEPPRVDGLRLDDVDAVAVQGQGWGSALILTPDLLRPILGPHRRTLLTPNRNTLIALPDPVSFVTAAAIWDAVVDGRADELDVPPLRWTGSIVTGLADDRRALPN